MKEFHIVTDNAMRAAPQIEAVHRGGTRHGVTWSGTVIASLDGLMALEDGAQILILQTVRPAHGVLNLCDVARGLINRGSLEEVK